MLVVLPREEVLSRLLKAWRNDKSPAHGTTEKLEPRDMTKPLSFTLSDVKNC